MIRHTIAVLGLSAIMVLFGLVGVRLVMPVLFHLWELAGHRFEKWDKWVESVINYNRATRFLLYDIRALLDDKLYDPEGRYKREFIQRIDKVLGDKP